MGKKNKLSNLHDHLFEQLERLNDDDLKGDDLEAEIERAAAMSGVAKQIINVGSLALKSQKALAEGQLLTDNVPDILSLEDKSGVKEIN